MSPTESSILFRGAGAAARNNVNLITTVAGYGIHGDSGDGGPAVEAQLCGPRGVAVDAGGNLYISDQCNNCVRKVDPNGIITTETGNGIAGYGVGDGRSAKEAQLNNPAAVAVDSGGNIYIADRLNNRIRKVSR